MRIILVLQYNGKHFCGWQIQPNERTVQQTVEDAILTFTGKHRAVTGSGRTDSGVHALCQVAHFDYDGSIPPEKFAPALNTVLPSDVKVVCSMQAPNDFHARFSAKKKTYCYNFYLSETPLPLFEPFAERIDKKVDFDAMQKACKAIEGTHDFKCFLASNSSVKDTVRTVYSCKLKRKNNLLTLTVCGNGFLYNMVRTIAGTVYFAGLGKINPDKVIDIINLKQRENVGKTLPAKGLFLQKVEYKGVKLPKI